jgi:hypothetical protein
MGEFTVTYPVITPTVTFLARKAELRRQPNPHKPDDFVERPCWTSEVYNVVVATDGSSQSYPYVCWAVNTLILMNMRRIRVVHNGVLAELIPFAEWCAANIVSSSRNAQYRTLASNGHVSKYPYKYSMHHERGDYIYCYGFSNKVIKLDRKLTFVDMTPDDLVYIYHKKRECIAFHDIVFAHDVADWIVVQ